MQLQLPIPSYRLVLSLVSETTIVGSGTDGVAGLAASDNKILTIR
jgi:hypothetical protein